MQLTVHSPVHSAIIFFLCLQSPYSLVRQPLATHQQGHQSTGVVPAVRNPAFKQPIYMQHCTVTIVGGSM